MEEAEQGEAAAGALSMRSWRGEGGGEGRVDLGSCSGPLGLPLSNRSRALRACVSDSLVHRRLQFV